MCHWHIFENDLTNTQWSRNVSVTKCVSQSVIEVFKMTTSSAVKDEDFDKMTTFHYSDVIMSTIASLITSLTIVYWIVYSDADQRKHQSPASLAFVWGIHRGPVNSPHKWPVTRKMFPFDDVIMGWSCISRIIPPSKLDKYIKGRKMTIQYMCACQL